MDSEVKTGIDKNVYQLLKVQKLEHGFKYPIYPPIRLMNMSGVGSPSKNFGWIKPDDQTTFQLLRNYFAAQLNIEESSEPVSVKLFNTNFFHNEQPCFDVCAKKSKDPNLCLRTWIFTHLHLTNGQKNHKVKSVPWFSLSPRTMNLQNVSGLINAVFIPKSDPNKLKLWCYVNHGEASPRDQFQSEADNFSFDEFHALSDSE